MRMTQWTLVAIDETRYWSDDIVAKAGTLYGIYLYDANRHTYCCELTPSYELYHVESVWTKRVGEDGETEIQDADRAGSPTVSYYHCRDIDKIDAEWKEALPRHDEEYEEIDDTGRVWEGLLEDMLEYLRGTQHVPAGVKFEEAA